MDKPLREIIREAYPDNERTRFIAEVENAEFNRTSPLDISEQERRERMNIEGAIAGLAFDRQVDYDEPVQRRHLLHLVDKHGVIEDDRRELENQMYIDKLTGLHNGEAFEQAKTHAPAKNGRAYIFMDMDNFRIINKTKGLGWSAGDKALQQAARHLLEISAVHGIHERNVFRLYGDEFVIISSPDVAEEVLADIEETYGDNRTGEQKHVSEHGNAVTSITGVIVKNWKEADNALIAAKSAKKFSGGWSMSDTIM